LKRQYLDSLLKRIIISYHVVLIPHVASPMLSRVT